MGGRRPSKNQLRLLPWEDWVPPAQKPSDDPLVTVLNFSGGKQSSAILWLVLLGKVERPDPFLVLNADPGMESSETYRYVGAMRNECAKVGIEFHTVPGPDLRRDLVTIGRRKTKRIDNPPLWTLAPDGAEGMLDQKCTRHYKVAPMDRFLRKWLEERYGISRKSKRLPEGCVTKWIGFAADEELRVRPSRRRYIRFDYPLVRLGWAKADVEAFFEREGLPAPPRSVCNACFANGLAYFQEMYENRPEDWRQAVEVDEAVRDLSGVGVRDQCFVSKTRIPLRELAERGFRVDGVREGDPEEWSCDSGYCFV